MSPCYDGRGDRTQTHQELIVHHERVEAVLEAMLHDKRIGAAVRRAYLARMAKKGLLERNELLRGLARTLGV